MDRGGFRVIVLVLLGLDGVLVGLLGTFFLPEFLGVVPFPISAIAAGAMNLALVWAAAYWAPPGSRLTALPMYTFLATVFVLMVFGPGGDSVYGGPGIYQAGPLMLLLLGCGPSVWWVLRRQRHAAGA